MNVEVVVWGLPADPDKRDLLRHQLNHPLPTIPDGSLPTTCADCGLAILVGPRSALAAVATRGTAYCPWCVRNVVAAARADDRAALLKVILDNSGEWE